MARKANEKLREVKRYEILKNARQILLKKGFANTTMKDIASAINLSRSGLYLYFSSTEEIMQAIITEREHKRFDVVREDILSNRSFEEVLDKYLSLQKERLLNISKSLLMSGYEYYSENSVEATNFLSKNLDEMRRTILGVLNLGVVQRQIKENQLATIGDHFILTIEGLSVFCYLHQASEKYIDEQLDLLKKLINYK
ncbi:TetR/AcrR family transcriptional regulator [Liquorilactobacillus uvarum]|uniref:TetR/AcrR family transcriptional regulator n=1 Tax=Liquorilactobacillus uvarum TaxID=303240 RepID=UPI00288A6802|nr:TetR/AcrR family transcriptional regulator [Liquorilactobacillus uvarum]